MFRDQPITHSSTERQRLTLNPSLTPFTTLSASGYRDVDRSIRDNDSLSEYIKTTLARKFSKLTITNPLLPNKAYMLDDNKRRDASC